VIRTAPGAPLPPHRTTTSIRAGGGTRLRSQGALARYNSRVAAGADAATRDALAALLEPGHGYDVLAGHLQDATSADRAAHGAHWLCEALAACAGSCGRATSVGLDAAAIADYLRGTVGAPGTVARTLGQDLATAVGGSVRALTLGGLPLRVLLPALVVLACPDLDRCPAEADVVRALAGAGAAAALHGLALDPAA
jgi:hypothetical protein